MLIKMRTIIYSLLILAFSIKIHSEVPCNPGQGTNAPDIRYHEYFRPKRNTHTALKCITPGRLSCKDKINLIALKAMQTKISKEGNTDANKERMDILLSTLSPRAQKALLAGSISEALERAKKADEKGDLAPTKQTPQNPIYTATNPKRIKSVYEDLISQTKLDFDNYKRKTQGCLDMYVRRAEKCQGPWYGAVYCGLSDAFNYTTGLDKYESFISNNELIDDCVERVSKARGRLDKSFFDWIRTNSENKKITNEEKKLLIQEYKEMTNIAAKKQMDGMNLLTASVTSASIKHLKGSVAVGASILTLGAAAKTFGAGTLATTGAGTTTLATIGTAALNGCLATLSAGGIIDGASDFFKSKLEKGGKLSCEDWLKIIESSSQSPKAALKKMAGYQAQTCGMGALFGGVFAGLFRGATMAAGQRFSQQAVEQFVSRAGVGLSSAGLIYSGASGALDLNKVLTQLSEVADYNNDPKMHECLDYASKVAFIDTSTSFAYDVVEILAGHYFAKPRPPKKPTPPDGTVLTAPRPPPIPPASPKSVKTPKTEIKLSAKESKPNPKPKPKPKEKGSLGSSSIQPKSIPNNPPSAPKRPPNTEKLKSNPSTGPPTKVARTTPSSKLPDDGFYERHQYHTTNSSILHGLEKTKGRLLSARKVLDEGGQLKSGEGNTFSGSDEVKDEIFVGDGSRGIGTTIAYFDAYNNSPHYNTSLFPDKKLQEHIDALELMNNPPPGHSLPPWVDKIHLNKQKRTDLLEKLLQEQKRRHGTGNTDPPNYPIMFEMSLTTQDGLKTIVNLPGEAVVSKQIDLKDKLTRVYVPKDKIKETKARLKTILGHEYYSVHSMSELKGKIETERKVKSSHEQTTDILDNLDTNIYEMLNVKDIESLLVTK